MLTKEPQIDNTRNMAIKIAQLEARVAELERQPAVRVIENDGSTTPTGRLGLFWIRTDTNKAHIWAESGWREIAAW